MRVHGDQIVPERTPGPALDGRSVDEVLAAARNPPRRRGLTRSRPRAVDAPAGITADELVDNLLAVFAVGASLVQVANPDAALLDRRRETEKVTKG